MKKNYLFIALICSACCVLTTGCKKKKDNVWDDNQTAGNYKGSNGRNLWGNDDLSSSDGFDPSNEDFVALKDDDLRAQFADGAIPQAKNSPGDFASGLPGVDGFHNPTGSEAAVFSTLYFNTDDHILRGKESLAALDKMASYLKAHPNVYIFVSGHCDERAPESYNLALGARRANYIRSTLVQKGVDLNRIHTISYGKEKPAAMGHDAQAWSKNRRAEFKIYQKS